MNIPDRNPIPAPTPSTNTDYPEPVEADAIVRSSGKWVVIPAADLPKVRTMNRHERRAFTSQLKKTTSRPGVAPAPTAKDHLKSFQKSINQLGADRTDLILENYGLRAKTEELRRTLASTISHARMGEIDQGPVQNVNEPQEVATE